MAKFQLTSDGRLNTSSAKYTPNKYKVINGKLQLIGDNKVTTTKNTIGSTIGKGAIDFGTGILQTGESLVDLATSAGGGIAGLFGADKLQQKARDYVSRDTTQETLTGLAGGFDTRVGENKLSDLESKSAIKTGSLPSQLLQGAGQLAGMVGTGGLLGGASGVSLGSSLSIPTAPLLMGAGSGAETAIKEGKTGLGVAGYSLGSGIVEAGTETLFGGLKIPGLKSPIDDIVTKAIGSGTASNGFKKLAKIAYNAVGEGTEEVLSGLGDTALRKLNNMDEVKQDYFNSFLVGGILGGIFGSSNINQTQSQIVDILDNLDSKTNAEINKAIETGVPIDINTLSPNNKAGIQIANFANEWIDKGRVFKKISKDTNNKKIENLYDLLLSTDSISQFEIGEKKGNEITGYQTNLKGKKIGKSQSEIFDKVNKSNLKTEIDTYAKHLHNIDRVNNGIDTGIDINESKAITEQLSKQYPVLIETMEDIRQYNKNDLQNRIDSGIMSTELADKLLKQYPNYVRLELENQDIEPYTQNITDAKVKETLQSAIEGEFNTKGIQEAMASQSLRVRKAMTQNMLANELSNHFESSIDETGGNLTYYKDGKRQQIKVGDEVIKALQPPKSTAIDNSATGKVLQGISKARKQVLTTKNPLFAFRNFFKDVPDGAINSKHTAGYVKNFPVALEAIFNPNSKNRAVYDRMLAMGGGAATIFDTKTGTFNAEKGVVGKGLDKIETFNNMIEHGPRLSEFMASLEAGESIEAAANNAAEITVNFKRGGDIARAVDRNGVTFLNASIQGFSKFIRNFTEEPSAKKYVGLLAKAFMVGMLPEIFNNLLYGDDEEFADISTDTKDKYYLFKSGDGKYIKIPKGRAQSIYTTISRRILSGKEEDETGLAKFAIEQIGPANPLSSNIASPLIQVATNKNFFGTDIVPQRLQDEYPSEQYDESTDVISKSIGKALNWSPKKINYVIDQYSGIIGDVVLPPLTPKAEPGLIEKSFGLDSAYADKNVTLFYDLQEELTKKKNSGIATPEEQLVLKQINSSTYDLNNLWAMRREIQQSDLSYKEKREQSKTVQKEINAFTKSVLDKFQ